MSIYTLPLDLFAICVHFFSPLCECEFVCDGVLFENGKAVFKSNIGEL